MKYGIHIGLNYLDPESYSGWRGWLLGCVKDADAMRELILADKCVCLYNEAGSIKNFIDFVSTYSSIMCESDKLFITYSGHGASIKDRSGDEADGKDEAWCFYDGLLLDDDVNKILMGVTGTVIVISDSCHSGTVTRGMKNLSLTTDSKRTKQIPRYIVDKAKQYKLESNTKPRNPNIVTLSACQDNQYSYDTDSGGLFTNGILELIRENSEYNFIELVSNLRLRITDQTAKLSYRNGKAILYKPVFV
ncbi:MAG TPA: caspase family protein [Saprospiraceae bacterium]|nr:caspase family protein [Saprospiraceae bacterium]